MGEWRRGRNGRAFLPLLHSPIFPFFLSRLWIALFVYAGHAQHAYLSPIPGGWEGVRNWWLNPWTTFDSQHFIHIAQHGYDAQTAAFFPLYPFLLKLAGNDPVWMAAWGILISNVAFLGALFIFYRLTEQEYSRRAAMIATWLLAFFPTSVIFSAVYTESLFLLLLVSAFWFWRARSWWLAALLFLLASWTRNIGPVLFAALALEWFFRNQNAGEYSRRDKWKALAPVAAPAIGFLSVQLLLLRETGIWLASVAGQKHFGAGSRAANWPWKPVLNDLQLMLAPGGFQLLVFFNVAACILVFWLLARHGKQQPLAYSLLTAGVILLHLTFASAREFQTLDALRYLSVVFPFVQLLTLDLEWMTANRARRAAGCAMLLLVCATLAYAFGQKSYVS
jgi:hypothetical protein